MDWMNGISIKSRMILSFAVVLLFFILFAVFSIIQMNELGKLTAALYEHPLKVSNTALRAEADVLRMLRSMKDVSMSRTDLELHTALQAVVAEEKNVYEHFDIAKSHILRKEEKALVKEAMEIFSGWKPIRKEVENLILKGDREAAGRITRGKGADYVSRLERKMEKLTSYAENDADGFMKDARNVQQRILRNTIIIVGIAAFLSLLVFLLIANSILSSVSNLKSTMSEITKTGALFKSELSGNNEIAEMAQHFNRLIDRLQDQFWLKEGQAAVGEEMIGDFSYEDLVTRGMNFISRYVDACAGALYSYDERRSLCELKASYALVEGKHFSNEFGLGEGIVGQVALEKKAVLLNGITREDGLGKTGTVSEPPKSIYALPLLYEGGLYGVLEVALFEEIDPLKIELLEMAAHITSTALHAATQKEQIKGLLELTQKNNEELKAQAEELQTQTEELQEQSEELRQTSDELQEQNVELELQKQQVEEANRLKSEFLSNMSHELRTPLNSVMALSRVLLMQAKEKLSEEELNYLEIIERNGKNLLSLINDILDLSKIEAGKMDISPKLFSVASTIEAIIERLTPIAEEKGIEVRQNIPDDLPQIESDEIRVHQILQNLIGNAVKFTKEGSVTVSAISDTENIRIEVADTGIGIAEKDLPHIFEEFRQVDGSSVRTYEGTGLGLTIAYGAAKMLGGDLTVESAPDMGSKFTLTLPVEGPEIMSGPESHVAIPPVEISQAQKTILVAEDDHDVASMLTEIDKAGEPKAGNRILLVEDNEVAVIQVSNILESDGYHVDVARGGQEALEYVRDTVPDGIILDLMIPEVDGFAVLEKIRSQKTTAKIPVLILTAKDLTQEDLEKLTGNNIQQLIQKGDVAREDLLLKVRSMLRAKTRVEFETGNLSERSEDPGLSEGETGKLVGARRRSRQDRRGSGKTRKPSDKPATILVVENNPDNMITIKAVLHNQYAILEATDGEEGLNMALTEQPDLVLLDMSLPKMDGFTVVGKIKEEEKTRHIPVIAMTARAMEGDREKIIEAGCDDYVSKPIDPEGILKKVEDRLRELS